MGNKIILRSLDSLIGEKFGNYSKYIIQERALPDLRDGLKPVQRRILYAMNDLKLTDKSPYKKSARIVGDVIGKYHPHGDTSVYDAMVRLSQEWKLNLPLIEMHGNKGSVDGDPPAAMRYTEVRLGYASKYLLMDLDKELVDFTLNFDDSEYEPIVLPARFPNLLVNGSTGIASGYSTNIPPHNFNEVIKALIFILKNSSVTLSQITRYIKGPDFPTGGIVQDRASIIDAYKTGKGKVIIRAKIDYDPFNNELLIREIPFEINKSELIRKIDETIRLSKLPGLIEVRDDTDRSGMLITLRLKDNANSTLIENYLYRVTNLQKNYQINFLAIEDNRPKKLGLLDILFSFADFQIKIYTKLFNYEQKKIKKRIEILQGLIKVVSIIDRIISIIKKSTNKQDAKEKIIKKYKFTNNQAEAIVNLRLYRLTSTDVVELKREYTELDKRNNFLNTLLRDRQELKNYIVTQLEELNSTVKIKRRSLIVDQILSITVEEKNLIENEQISLSISGLGYIRKISLKSKVSQKAIADSVREGDLLLEELETSNLNSITIFCSNGRYYNIPIYKLTYYKAKDIGDNLLSLIDAGPSVYILKIIISDQHIDDLWMLCSSEKGLIKRTPLKLLQSKTTKRGIIFMNLNEEDQVVSLEFAKDGGDYYITVFTGQSFVTRYDINIIPERNLTSKGVKSVMLDSDDSVVSTIVQEKESAYLETAQITVLTNNGKGKRFKSNLIKARKRRGVKPSLLIAKMPKSIYQQLTVAIPTYKTQERKRMLLGSNLQLNVDLMSILPLSNFTSGLNTFKKEDIKFIQSDLLLNREEIYVQTSKPKANRRTAKEKNILDYLTSI